MSIEWILSSCVLILFIIFIRFLLRRKISLRMRYALWLIVALRLLLPISFSQTVFSVMNLLPEKAENRNVPAGISLAEADDVTADAKAANMKIVNAGTGSTETARKAEADEMKNTDAIEKAGVKEWKDMAIVFFRFFPGFWMSGTGVCIVIFLLANLDYNSRLKRSRKRISDENLPTLSVIPVYETEIVTGPCLFGLFHPAVYVPECVAEDGEKFVFVLSHENTHYRHHDNWWALLRIFCVCLHWFNPLVWVSVYLSKQDAELACDERTLKNLGDEVRIAYGEALLSLCAVEISGMDRWRISTTMSGSKNQLKERLQMVVHVPKKSAGAYLMLFIVIPFILAAAFTGREKTVEAKQTEPKEVEIGTETDSAVPEQETDLMLPNEAEENTVEADEPFDQWKFIPVQELSYDGMLVNEQKDGVRAVVYCRYDEENHLHMVRYTEENPSEDAIFGKMDLTYVEDDGMYTMQAMVDDGFYLTAVAMAKQALTELYQWTGEKVDTAYFQVSNVGGVTFTVTADDMKHSRIFFSRYFGADTEYSISEYNNIISSITVTSGRAVWYSPILWRYFPYDMESMTDEEVIIWYVERLPYMEGDEVVSIEKRYEDMWTIHMASDRWFEVIYNKTLREVYDVTGPYSHYPEH